MPPRLYALRAVTNRVASQLGRGWSPTVRQQTPCCMVLQSIPPGAPLPPDSTDTLRPAGGNPLGLAILRATDSLWHGAAVSMRHRHWTLGYHFSTLQGGVRPL
jgi:hypothetical protein